ncbi:MAG: hypothetical protein NTY11_02830 [Candidatus Parcubacteria bacterium]|nr:hypothetical protein [Candidatus Parcubacteria bacterium]
MDNNSLKNNIKEQILKRIKDKEVHMTPKVLFLFKTALFILGIILFFCLGALIFSFIMFKMHATGLWHTIGFGPRGIGIFFAGFPWFLLVFILVLVVILEFLAEKFSWVYKKPLVYSILGIIVFVLLVGFIVSLTPMHPQLFRGVTEGNMPIVEPFYRAHIMQSSPNIHIGEISTISDEEIIMKNEKGEVFTIIISPETILQRNEEMSEGDLIMVVGDESDSSISAFGIRQIEEERESFFPQFDGRKEPKSQPHLK